MSVQRLCALLLLALSAWLTVAPLAFATGEQTMLPACCRRQGAHHCAAKMLAAVDRGQVSLRAAPCPMMPHNSPALLDKFAGIVLCAPLAALPCRSPFLSTEALEGYARALALKSPRGPPRLAIA